MSNLPPVAQNIAKMKRTGFRGTILPDRPERAKIAKVRNYQTATKKGNIMKEEEIEDYGFDWEEEADETLSAAARCGSLTI